MDHFDEDGMLVLPKSKVVVFENEIEKENEASKPKRPKKGWSMSKEQKEKISKANKGRLKGTHRTFTPEHKRRISEAKKGKPTWNKGLKGVKSKRDLKKIREEADSK